jgi:S1-C subfamily serine protease
MTSFRRFHIRVVLFVVTGLVAIAVGAGLALASNKAAPIGTGVVVINTNLGYQNSAAAGTGMVLTSSGEILTNNHVISGATTIKVVVPNTTHKYTARVVGYSRTADVAVLQLQNASNLKTISVGDSSKLTVGQAVTGLGNAGGTGSLTSATGTITGLGKSITASDEAGGSEQLVGLIETNAGIQAGDSGGPLLDSAGRVIGMDTAASAGVGFQQAAASDAFAIPIGKATTIAKEIEAGKTSTTVHIGATAFLGIQVESLDSAGPGFGNGGSSGTGALVAGVVSGGPAASGGLVAGDVITALNGKEISSPTAIPSIILKLKPGAKIAVTYSDQLGTSQTTNITLGTGPAQ